MFGRVEELAIVLVIVLVLFGGRKLPELSRSIGQSVREVKKGFRDEGDAPQAAVAKSKTEA